MKDPDDQQLVGVPDEDLVELYEQAPCGYLSTLPDGTIVRVNETFLRWTGYTREQLLGTSFQALLTVPGRIFYDTHYGPLLAMQGAVREIAFDVVRRGRPPLPTIVSATAQRDATRRIVSYRTALFDCSDRRRYEQELLLARSAAEHATTEKDAVLSTISHEMRSPLATILLGIELLEPSNEEQAKYVRMIARATTTVLEFVDAILENSKLAAGAVVWQARELDLVDFVDDLVASFTLKAEVKRLGFVAKIDPRVPRRVVSDSYKLGRVLTNLLANAIKFTHEGAVTLEVRLLELGDRHARVRFSVIDTGIGIPHEKLGTIFEEFQQATSETTAKYGGSGLGLAISRKLLALVGSSVEVTSEPGTGSTFSFVLRLPIAASGG